MKTSTVFLKFIGGLVGSIFIGMLFGGVFNPFNVLGGDKGGVFISIFLGMPLGSILGIIIIDKAVYKLKSYNLLGIFIGFILSFLGGVESVIVLDKFGGTGIVFAPIISTLLALAGYSIPAIKKKVKMQGKK